MPGRRKAAQVWQILQVAGMFAVVGWLAPAANAVAEVPAEEVELMLSRFRTMLVGPPTGEGSEALRQAVAREDRWVAAALERQIRDENEEHYGAIDPVVESGRNYRHVGISQLLPPAVKLARAYACPASRYHRDRQVQAAVDLSLRYAMKRAYPGCEKVHNWWCWEMAMPEQIGELLVLMAEDLPADVRESFQRLLDELNPPQPIEDHWGSYHSASLALSQLRSGLVLRDPRRLQLAREGMQRACRRPWNRGLQPDYSNHDEVGGTGVGGMDLGYNNDMLAAAGKVVYCTRGTSLALDPHSIEGLTGYVLEFHRWAIWRGWSNPFLFGRGVAAEGHKDGDLGSAAAILYLVAAGVYRADEMTAFMKRVLLELPGFRGLGPLGDVGLLDEIKSRPVPAEEPPLGCRFWPWNEYLVYRTPRFFTSVLVSGAANPTIPWYQINDQSRTAWHGRDGNVVTILDSWDLGPDLFPTLDWDRLTGITTEDGSHYESFAKSRNPFSGGVTLDDRAGIVGMDLRVGTLEARRSYVFFGECMVSQASGVRSAKHAETVVRQVPLRRLEDPVRVNGEQIRLEPDRPTVLEDVRWLHAGRGGYGFPGGAVVTLLLEQRTGTWQSVNALHPSTKELSRPYLQVLLDHGSSPTGAECASVTWPAAELESMEERMQTWERNVRLRRADGVHAVETPDFRAMVFFEPAEADGYGLDRPGCLMVRHDGASARIAVSEASLRGSETNVVLPFGVDRGRLPRYVTVVGKPNRLRVFLQNGLQREFDVETE